MNTVKTKPIASLLCLVSLALALLCATPAWAAPSDDKQAEAEVAYAQLIEKQAFLDQTSNEYGEAVMAQEAADAAELLAQEIAAAQEPVAAPDPGDNDDDDDGDGDDSSNHNYRDDYEGPTDPDAVVGRAMDYLGQAQYVWGSVAPGRFDCSGFVSYCLSGEYRRLGTTCTFIYLPEMSDPRPGDICVNWEHCGIYLGDGRMIHCTSSANNVIISPVQSGMIYVRW